MPDSPALYTLAANEKTTPVMIYSADLLARGEIVTRADLRVGAWLRATGAPEFLALKNAQVIAFGAGAPQSQSFSEFHTPTAQVLACHLTPPAQEALDYDASEPNRKMEPVIVSVGAFRFAGRVRMAAQSDFKRFLEVTQAVFLSLYDVEITNPILPAMGVLRAPIAWVRMGRVSLGLKAAGSLGG